MEPWPKLFWKGLILCALRSLFGCWLKLMGLVWLLCWVNVWLTYCAQDLKILYY